jgi:hypothetical protein
MRENKAAKPLAAALPRGKCLACNSVQMTVEYYTGFQNPSAHAAEMPAAQLGAQLGEQLGAQLATYETGCTSNCKGSCTLCTAAASAQCSPAESAHQSTRNSYAETLVSETRHTHTSTSSRVPTSIHFCWFSFFSWTPLPFLGIADFNVDEKMLVKMHSLFSAELLPCF